jgi:hypothetical protein
MEAGAEVAEKRKIASRGAAQYRSSWSSMKTSMKTFAK